MASTHHHSPSPRKAAAQFDVLEDTIDAVPGSPQDRKVDLLASILRLESRR